MGQRRDLLRREGHAHRQVQRVFAGDGVVHQVLELILVGGLSIDERLTGACGDGLLDEALFVQAITQAFGTDIGVVAQAREQVIRTHELLKVGEYRVGFDQVFVAIGLST
ncbi:hypothetical protein [Pseudomonas sp. PB3P13]